MLIIGPGPFRAPVRATSILIIALALAAAAPLPARAQGDAATTLESGADRMTGIRGRIVDRRSGKPLESAPVLVQGGGRMRNTVTDAQGGYRFFLPPGNYTIRSYFPLYHGAKITGAVVARGAFIDVNLGLPRIDEERDVSIEELEIPYRADTTTAAAQDQLRQASSGIGEGLGAKQMSQAGASDAGSAAARVVGVTIESSQLVIRGLGGRYTRVLLNGIPVPSVDPDVPGADLDLFPTSVIDSLNISKTFLPDIPADFAGGVMEIKSVSFPRKFTLELGLSTGFDSLSTFRQRLDYKGGTRDNLGFDDGRRSLPDGLPSDKPLSQLPDLERYAAARQFRNSWQYRRKSALPRMGLEATLGDSINFSGRKRLGYLLTASYDYDSVRKVGVSHPHPVLDGRTGSLVLQNDYKIESGADEVSLSALGTASLDLGLDHSLTVLSLYNRAVTDETSLQAGNSADYQGYIEKWQLQFLARTLWFNQAFGDHRNLFGTRLRLRWSAFHAYGNRDEPDRRTVAYGDNGGVFGWLVRAGSGERFYSRLRQDDIGGTLSLRFPLWAQGWGTLGGFMQGSGRDFFIRRLRMTKNQNNTDSSVFSRPIEELLSPEMIGQATDIREEPQPNDAYTSSQRLYSGYFLLESPIVGPLSVAAGVRAEASRQEVESRSPFPLQDMNVLETSRSDLDFLPGAALKYQLSPKMVLRAAYGITAARPQIRELAPYRYYDFLRDRSVEGNAELKRSLIHNADLRAEWFFAEGQILALSAFHKRFIDPIELTIIDNVGGGTKYNNGSAAQNLGVEAEARVNLGRLAKGLRHFDFDANFAVVRSRIELPPELSRIARASRPLAGQSPYVANLSLRFFKENEATHRSVTAALVYNVVGPRIAEVATLLGNVIPPDIEEQAFHSLDLVASIATGEHLKLKLKLKVRNLLYQSRELKQGDFLIQRLDPGISASLGLALSY
jgi:TonB dependent receptor/Carboxypeptidase regulatory-like domain/TonB-dependent Receptor Plug Domain